MKRTLLIAVIIIMAVTLVQGQKINFGPKVGYSASKLSTNLPDITEDIRHNFMAGLFLRIGNKVYFQPELLYHARGGILDSAGHVQKIKFSNIDVPFIVGFKLLDLKVFNLRFMGGPVASFVLDKEITFNDLVKNPFKGADFKNMIWGLDVGLGIDVLFLTLDVRYEFGLNNIYITPENGQAYDMKNNLFTVGLGFKIF
jgi:hypothetical protein